jgi:2-polyprenyl-6-hydroxyphenyl methylase/3-demethylubiquinone-9 3-methyltransferase
MSIGPLVRRCLGPLERPVTDLYRAGFINLDRFVRLVRDLAPDARQILEVGCGEGAVLERLARLYPQSELVGIDITPRVGRMFRGDRQRVTFRQQTVQQVAADHPGQFDLAVVCDVIHHVPWEMHIEFVRALVGTVRPGGLVILKDWERRSNVIHAVAHFADARITGDTVRYRTGDEFRELFDAALGPGHVVREQRVPPWPNNLAFLIRP